MTEANWRQVMIEFKAGMTDRELSQRWDISMAAIRNQRWQRGVMRVHVQRAAPLLLLPAPPPPDEPDVELSRVERVLGLRPAPRASAPAEPFAPRPLPPILRPAQQPPEGAWKTWLFLGGRGAGKTLAGAAWLAAQARSVERLALVGPTIGDVREVMIEGPSGLRGSAAGFGPDGETGARPTYEPSRRRLVWPNGAVAGVFTAEDPDGLRGPQFAAAWADEVCAWPHTASKGPEETLAMLRMGLRLGDDPRLVLTTTPRPTAGLARLMKEPTLRVTRGSALENAEHLAPGFVEDLRALYGGTRLEAQEIDGEVLEALQGAVFRRAELDRARALWTPLEGEDQRFDRLVIGVDPPAGVDGAACGIVVAGRIERRAVVLEDRTAHGLTPLGWAGRVADAADRAARRGPVTVVAEANQGGEMVRQVLRNAGLAHPVRLVHATVGKAARAEPVALLYEQGRIAHAPGLEALEDQMLLLGAVGRDAGGHSPDRADALVWALTALLVGPPEAVPRVRWL